jgi:hypothetical protein
VIAIAALTSLTAVRQPYAHRVPDRQWVLGVIVVLIGLAVVIGLGLYLETYF